MAGSNPSSLFVRYHSSQSSQHVRNRIKEWKRECDLTQATSPASVTSRTIVVEHIRLSSWRSFAEVRREFERAVPKLDADIAEVLRSGDKKRAKDYQDNGPRLSIFGERDHGALLRIVGKRRNAVQYDVGNPLTASMMTRHQLPAALYAPLRVVLFEDRQGRGSLNTIGHRRSLGSMAISA